MNRKLRIGVLGAGWWGTANHLPILTQRAKEIGDIEVVGVCRLGKEELKAVQDAFELEKATEDYTEMFDWDLDGLVIATPHHLRYEHTKAALDAGLHVLVEKPFVQDSKKAWELVHLADEKKLHMVIPHGWQYFDFVEEAHRQGMAKRMGNYEFITCHTATPTKGLYSGEGVDMGTLSGMFESDLSIYSTHKKGGGYSWGHLPHSLSMLFFITGAKPAEVFAYISSAGAKVDKVDMNDAISVKFENGAIGTITGTGEMPPLSPFQLDLRIFGDEGYMVLDVERERMEVRRWDGDNLKYEIPAGGGIYNCFVPPIRWVELMKGENVENNSGGDIEATTVSVIEAALKSGKTGKPEKVLYY